MKERLKSLSKTDKLYLENPYIREYNYIGFRIFKERNGTLLWNTQFSVSV